MAVLLLNGEKCWPSRRPEAFYLQCRLFVARRVCRDWDVLVVLFCGRVRMYCRVRKSKNGPVDAEKGEPLIPFVFCFWALTQT